MASGLHILSGTFIAAVTAILFCTKDVLNLNKQYVAYAIFHQDKVNKLCHQLAVWPIFWTFLVMFQHSRPVVSSLPFTTHAFFICVTYMMYYIVLERSLQTIAAAALVLLCGITSGLVARAKPRSAAYAAAAANALCWVAQFYTHAKHEGRQPALLKNPAQAFLLAPLFVLFETLFDGGVGIEREAAFQPLVKEAVAKLDAGRFQEVSLLEFRPVFVGAAVAYGLALVLLSMRSGGKDEKVA